MYENPISTKEKKDENFELLLLEGFVINLLHAVKTTLLFQI